MDRPRVSVKLDTPIGKRGQEIAELELVQPRVRELRQALDRADGQIDQQRRLIAICADVEPPLVDQMSLSDFRRVSEALFELMPQDWVGELKARDEDADDDEDEPGKGSAG